MRDWTAVFGALDAAGATVALAAASVWLLCYVPAQVRGYGPWCPPGSEEDGSACEGISPTFGRSEE